MNDRVISSPSGHIYADYLASIVIHLLAAPGLRGSFLTGRPDVGAPIVNIVPPLSPVVGVCGADAPNVPVGV